MGMQVPRTVLTAVVIALIFVVVGDAQKVQVETHRDERADFSAIKTYGWLPPMPVIPNAAPGSLTNPTLTQEALRPHLVAAVDRQLSARGWTQTDQDSADVQVASFAVLTADVSQTYVGEYYGYVTGWASPIAPGLAPSVSSTIHEKGTVVVDLVQRTTKRAIWRAVVKSRIEQDRSVEQRAKRINEAVARMFQRFPVTPK
jgi:uncharacterized protein DUF4136